MQRSRSMPFYHRVHPKQLIKWTVYIILLVNWGFYIVQDWQVAQHTLRSGGTLWQWASAFSTSLDEAAWFGLLFLWELETYALSEAADTPFIQRLLLLIRGLCYVFIAHTVVARVISVNDLRQLEPAPGISSLCQLTEQQTSFTYNLRYSVIDAANCSQLSTASQFYFVDNTAITDAPGLRVERQNAWIDLQDAIAWLLVMLSIEIAIWLQERGIQGGMMMLASHSGKILYGVLFAHAAYWAWRGHWLYGWDQVVWISGFFAIELNIRDWRREASKPQQG